ncbi:hypothetical protein ACWT_5973 [Actinoplanes sp. SE50]|uniref:hypothetical protein n=1 Tax=unclassified Actinoplanes TaxID=2626549 RepID=UPI00023EC342|nr:MULTISPECIES: hypothetical protein [unclassified Actinoplanes]AEV86992.1 hypothetical protein ACPL_6105 [Actinoplanes sp. SE50/110]ATO85388.1 hypothetical protein ACWT_5973 [Actinoplanes sp. SE50]SLM02800.1 hypothetical protein ACSP50_6085 [Actinoplanes sp. SE50/110]
MIPGYLDGYEPPIVDSPLVDGSALMAHDLFWPAFLSTVGGSATAPYAFGADPADLDEMVDAFLDEHEWPVFSLLLAGTGQLHVVMRNLPDDGGVDYVLDPGTGSRSIPLAALDGHFRGPALAWPELIDTARPPGAPHTSAERLLLLLPACADRDRPSDVTEMVAAALTAVGAVSGTHAVAEELLDSPRFWTRDCGWTIVDQALVCLGSHAYRSADAELTSSDLRLVTEAFRSTSADPA